MALQCPATWHTPKNCVIPTFVLFVAFHVLALIEARSEINSRDLARHSTLLLIHLSPTITQVNPMATTPCSLCEVCPGRKFFRKERDTTLLSPPYGYDSVYGLTGGELNYEEIAIYDPDAILPKFIILY